MPRTAANGIELHYESFGAASAPAILLIMGLGVQLTRWNIELCDLLVARGYRVIRFDNRDCGFSTHCDGMALPDIGAAMRGDLLTGLPYTLETMAADCIGLLDVLKIEQAHLVGASMGASIAHLIAARYPARTHSLTSIMSSSGNPMLPPPKAAAAMALFTPLPATRDRTTIVNDAVARYLPLASPGYPTSRDDLQTMFGQEYDRCFYPQGVARQLGALIANGDRRRLLKTITCPTVVLHGKDDPLIQLACGEDVANNIPNAEMREVEGMGHDFPVALSKIFADAIGAAAARSVR
ncbi:alpha/beta fold hydrolase [Propionivibrio sp.]|uniref:alpha/beta fold hydrolase n=1 Tax=Propionivibrio sp. TaxID=2212460 RepID=UPI003BEF9753